MTKWVSLFHVCCAYQSALMRNASVSANEGGVASVPVSPSKGDGPLWRPVPVKEECILCLSVPVN